MEVVVMRDIKNILSEGLVGRRTHEIQSVSETLSRCLDQILKGTPDECPEASHEMVRVLDAMGVEKIVPGSTIDLWEVTKSEDIILALYETVPNGVLGIKRLYIIWTYEGLNLKADLNKNASRRFILVTHPMKFEAAGLGRPQGSRSPGDPGTVAFIRSHFIFQDKEKGYNRIYRIKKDSSIRKMIELFARDINNEIDR